MAKHKPNVIALQETHIIQKNLHLLHLPGYQIFHHNHDFNYAKSGIELLVKENLNVAEHITSIHSLLYQTIVLSIGIEIHITNIYKELDINLSSSMVSNISLKQNVHNIVLGDFNAQNILWGSSTNSPNGKVMEDFANDNDLVILNDGSPTLFSTRGTLTAIDVSMVSVDIAPNLNW